MVQEGCFDRRRLASEYSPDETRNITSRFTVEVSNEESSTPIDFDWTITNLTNSEINLQLNFANPKDITVQGNLASVSLLVDFVDFEPGLKLSSNAYYSQPDKKYLIRKESKVPKQLTIDVGTKENIENMA